MSRMLEALQQIEAQSPPARPTVRPVSPEELESYGLRRSPGPETQQPSPATQAVPEAEAPEPAQPAEPDERDVSAESTDSGEVTAPSEPDEVKLPLEQAEAELAEVDVPDAPSEPDEVKPAADQAEAALAEVDVPDAPGEPDKVTLPAEQAEAVLPEVDVPDAPSEPDEIKPAAEQGEARVAEVDVSDTAAQAAPVRESNRSVRRLLGPVAAEHGEPYRQLAGNILAQLPPAQPAVLMFTSPTDQGAKAGVLAALAVAIAEEVAEDVVVVDADFRSPALAGDFGIWADRGLADVLTGESDWREVVRKTSAKHLSVLPGGRFPGEEEPLSGDSRLASLLQTLRRSYRLVLVNTATLEYPEVAPLSGSCDGTYLVLTLGRTERDAARRAVRLIKRCGGRVLGCVLTNVSGAS